MLQRVKSHLRRLKNFTNIYSDWQAERIIRASGMLDEQWYLETNPDVKESGLDATLHYIRFGSNEGRNPSSGFSSTGYLSANPDVAEKGINPLIHYIRWGLAEGRPVTIASEVTDSIVQAAHAVSPTAKNISHSNKYTLRVDSLSRTHIRGWCVDKANNTTPVNLKLYVNGIPFSRYPANNYRNDLFEKGISNGFSGFNINNPIRFMESGLYRVSFQFPSGSFSDEFVFKNESKPQSFARHPDEMFLNNGLTIIVPVFNAPDDLKVCLERLIAWTPEFAEILVINDKSTDPTIEIILAEYKDNDRIRILRNDVNLGFTRTSNRGIAEAGRNDVILLNSDARVTPGWLQGMLIAAASSPRIATVTAMSDRAGAFSSPKIGNDNELPFGVDEITFARSFRRSSSGVYPSVPTGNGFCLFIRRACLDEIGNLDAIAFPRGYGEENDFCMRALHAGWKHIIDDRTYVFHDRSKSFGETKSELLENGAAILRERYPEYKSAISVFGSDEKIHVARYNGYVAQVNSVTGKTTLPRVMFVISTTTGGTPQTNKDLMAGVKGSLDAWLLRCDREVIELSHLLDGEFRVVRSHRLQSPIGPVSHFSDEYDAVVFGWLFEFDIDIVHIRHLAWHSLSLPSLVHRLGRKVVTSFHDYYTLSPTIKLLDDSDVFLGNDFSVNLNHRRETLWPADSMPLPTGAWLDTWQRKFAKSLSASDALVTTSEHAKKLILNTLPQLDDEKFFVIPHGRDFQDFHQIRKRPTLDNPIRILVPGNINAAKGLDVIYSLAEYDIAGKLEFHILGSINDAKNRFHPRIINHGGYVRDSFASKASSVSPHIGAVFSIWDETYCHTLTEMWAIGIPSIVLNFPTLADRVRKSGAGWVMDHNDIEKLYQNIVDTAYDEQEQNRVDQALLNWKSGEGAYNTVRFMASQYYDIYRDLLNNNPISTRKKRPPRVAVVCPSAPNLNVANASTHIRIWERTLNSVDRNVTYVRMLPETLIASARYGKIDGAIIQRTAIPPEVSDELISVLKDKNIPFVYDIDDDLLAHVNRPDSSIDYAQYKNAITSLLENANIITVSTMELMKRYKSTAKSIKVVPNFLSDRLWSAAPITRQDDGIVRALYMGTPTHDEDLDMILPALEAIAQAYPNFRFMIVGVSQSTDSLRDYPWIELVPPPSKMSDYNSFVPWLREVAARCDFALAPLVDTPFNRCKSDLKLLDYAALGLPILASNIPQYRIDAPYVTLVSDEQQEWEYALAELINGGQRNLASEASQRSWIVSNRMLKSTLPDFDNFITRMIALSKRKKTARK